MSVHVLFSNKRFQIDNTLCYIKPNSISLFIEFRSLGYSITNYSAYVFFLNLN